MPWTEPKENKDLKDIVRRSFDYINAAIDIRYELLTSIRGEYMYVELNQDGMCIAQTERKLPNEEFDDVKMERELLEELITELIVDGIEQRNTFNVKI